MGLHSHNIFYSAANETSGIDCVLSCDKDLCYPEQYDPESYLHLPIVVCIMSLNSVNV